MSSVLDRISYTLKHNKTALDVYRAIGNAFFNFAGLFLRTDSHLVLFSGLGAKFNDSPKAIFDYMAKEGLTDQYRCVWAVKDPKAYRNANAAFIKADSPKYFITALKAKYWIAAVNIERGLHFKKKDTVYLNTWHGIHVGLVGNAVGIRDDFDWSNVDFVCCSGEYEKEIFRKDFGAKSEAFLDCGLPRNDRLYLATEQEHFEIRKAMGIPEKATVILYAPTWRDSQNGGLDYSMEPPINWQSFVKRLKGETIVLSRAHGITTNIVTNYSDCVIDCSDYPDVNDLIIASDMLVTDYSCIALDYAITEKPFCCFGYDYEEYKYKRGFYFDISEEYPGGVLGTAQELFDYISSMDPEEAKRVVREIKSRRLNYGGHAAEVCCRALFGYQKAD